MEAGPAKDMTRSSMKRSPGDLLVLVVEDELTLAQTIELYLRNDGYRTERALDGQRALDLFRTARPDLVLLDLGLPKVDGTEVLRLIRAESDVPVVVLTARSEEVDELLGLGLGADDYLVKPVSARKLLARVKVVLRRALGGNGNDAEVLRVGPLEVDAYRVQARVHDRPLDLTPTEFRLLQHLARTPGRAVPRSELYDAHSNRRRCEGRRKAISKLPDRLVPSTAPVADEQVQEWLRCPEVPPREGGLMNFRLGSLAVVLLSVVLGACSYVATPEVWVGVSQQLSYTSSVDVQFRRIGDEILGTYNLNGDLDGNGRIEGTIRDGIIIATLEPSTTCRFQLVGTATKTTIKANFEPDPCPAGYAGTWSLQRQN